MRPCRIVVVGILPQHATQVSLVRDQDLVEAFSADRAYPTLGDSIRIGGTKRGQDSLDTFGDQYGFKGAHELGISIMDQKPDVALLLLELPGQLSGLLSDPSR